MKPGRFVFRIKIKRVAGQAFDDREIEPGEQGSQPFAGGLGAVFRMGQEQLTVEPVGHVGAAGLLEAGQQEAGVIVTRIVFVGQ